MVALGQKGWGPTACRHLLHIPKQAGVIYAPQCDSLVILYACLAFLACHPDHNMT